MIFSLAQPLIVPRVWRKLLDIQEFPADTPKRGNLADVNIREDRAYRDDRREVVLSGWSKDFNWIVSLHLRSGSTNYWVYFEVDGHPECQTLETEPEYELFAGEVRLYPSKRPGNLPEQIELTVTVEFSDEQ